MSRGVPFSIYLNSRENEKYEERRPIIMSCLKCNSPFFKIAVSLTMAFLLSPNLTPACDTGAAYSTGLIIQGQTVHQHITKEAVKVWINQEAQDEFQSYSTRSVTDPVDAVGMVTYDPARDDLISGSAEEDQERLLVKETCNGDGLNGFFEHFWDPDEPWEGGYNCGSIGGWYNAGLPKVFIGQEGHYDSAYRLAQYYWDQKVIPFYRNGDKRQAYYWLGRIAHLIQDMTVPAHVHNRYHDPVVNESSDVYEDYAKLVYKSYSGDMCIDRLYEYENLIGNFQWNSVHDQPNPPNLFKLFWYVAQKTQYFATVSSQGSGNSNWAPGNDWYVLWNMKNGNRDPRFFNPSLWSSEYYCDGQDPITIIGDPNQISDNRSKLANALTPHAMKATTALYRLFWHETHPLTPLILEMTASPDPVKPGELITYALLPKNWTM
jgi:hypothetical protein